MITTHPRAATGAAFALPAVVLMLATLLAPLAMLAWLSLTDYELGAVTARLVGLENYARALDDLGHQHNAKDLLTAYIHGLETAAQEAGQFRKVYANALKTAATNAAGRLRQLD